MELDGYDDELIGPFPGPAVSTGATSGMGSKSGEPQESGSDRVPSVPGPNRSRGAPGFSRDLPFPSKLSSLVHLLETSSETLLRRLGIRPSSPQEQIKVLMKEGTKTGIFGHAEQEMVKRVFRLGDRRASVLMTPMQEVVWLDVSDSPEQMQRKIRESPHSRFPVCEGTIDAILGVVQVKDLLIQSFTGQPFSIKGLLTLPLFLYEGTPGLKVLEMFRQTGTHIAVVLDEFGSIVGLLTLSDIVKAIVGEMPVDVDSAEQKSVRRYDGTWLLDGRLSPDEFGDLFDDVRLPVGDYRTLAGFIVSTLGHIPQVSERFAWAGLTFEVVVMEGHRVEKVLVSPQRDV
jgi:magnesium and cobalt exporter, CNNM family